MNREGIDGGKVKERAASLSLAYNCALTLLKVVAATLTGSVSLFSETVHSGTDVLASFLALASVRAASVPPDDDHPYGHGKIESLSGLGESAMLLLILVFVVGESVRRILQPRQPQHVELGLLVMAISAVANLIVGRVILGVAKKTDSLALRSNGRHILVDFWTSVGVLCALAVTGLTGWVQADSAFAILFAAWLVFGAFKTVRESVDQLIDHRLPEADVEQIRSILRSERGVISFHRLRSRMSGSVRYADVHVVVPNDWSVVQAHNIADRLEKQISNVLAPAQVFIHVDPFDPRKLTQAALAADNEVE